MANTAMATEVTGLSIHQERLYFFSTVPPWSIGTYYTPWSYQPFPLSSQSYWLSSLVPINQVEAVRGPEDRVKFVTAVAENHGSSIVRQGGLSPDDIEYLAPNVGVGFTDPLNPCIGGGGSGSERPDDGLLYPRGQG